MRFYSYILISLCGKYVCLMVPFVGICRVFIFSFFHIRPIITVHIRRNYIFIQYTWSSFFVYVFLSEISFKPINFGNCHRKSRS